MDLDTIPSSKDAAAVEVSIVSTVGGSPAIDLSVLKAKKRKVFGESPTVGATIKQSAPEIDLSVLKAKKRPLLGDNMAKIGSLAGKSSVAVEQVGAANAEVALGNDPIILSSTVPIPVNLEDYGLPPGEEAFQKTITHADRADQYVRSLTRHFASSIWIAKEWANMQKEWSSLRVLTIEESEKARNAEWARSVAERKLGEVTAELAKAQEAAFLGDTLVKKSRDHALALKEKLAAAEKDLEQSQKARTVLVAELADEKAKSAALEVKYLASEARLTKAEAELAHSKDEVARQGQDLAALDARLQEKDADQRWLMSDCMSAIVDRVLNSDEMNDCLANLLVASRQAGQLDVMEGRVDLSSVHADLVGNIFKRRKDEFNNLKFQVVDVVSKLSLQADGLARLKEALRADPQMASAGEGVGGSSRLEDRD